MIGLDTSILVARAIPEHPDHIKVCARLDGLSSAGRSFALTSGALAEFVHIVTDPRRFEDPLTMAEALEWAEFWSEAAEVEVAVTDGNAIRQWRGWLAEHRLGRKRLLDTLIAATWHGAGVRQVLTLNPGDFRTLGVFDLLEL